MIGDDLTNRNVTIILCNSGQSDFQNDVLTLCVNRKCDYCYVNKKNDSIVAIFTGGSDSAVVTAIKMHDLLTNNQISDFAISINTAYILSASELIDSIDICSSINNISDEYGLSIGVSHNAFVSLNNPNIYNYRFTDKIDSIAIFDFVDGEPYHKKKKKIESKSAFEDSVFNFYRNRFAEACAGFNNTLLLYPEDKASVRYLKILKIKGYM